MFNLEFLVSAAQEILTLKTVLLFVIGTIVGMIVGSLPGLTTTMGIALLIPFTWGMDWVEAMVLIISFHVGGTYGGSTSAIFLNLPGTPASAATALDGYPMALRGEGGLVRGLATVQSCIGTVFASFLFLIAAPFLAKFSMNVGSWEYFLMALFGIVISANLSSESTIKGLISGCLGLMISVVGMDSISGHARFTFGQSELLDGFSLIAVLIGLFGINEVISSLIELRPPLKVGKLSSTIPPFSLLKKYIPVGGRSSVIGALIGAVPGAGADIAAWVSYDMAKRKSKQPETFGKGNPEGVVASETANNACVPGTYVPMLTLGIPGDAVTAVILGALMLHGLNPGPLLTVEQPGIIYQFFVALLLSSVALLILGLSFSKVFERVLLLPKSMVLMIVTVLSIVGTYAVNNRFFDIFVMLAFGLLGYLMRIAGIHAAPMVLGIILGPMAESNFRRAMVSADYSFLPFITRPLSLILIVMIVFILIRQNRFVSENLSKLGIKFKHIIGGKTDA